MPGLLGCGSQPPRPLADPEQVAEVEAWRARRLERLQAEDGWLAVVGLTWLEPGENSFGHDPGNAVVLPGEGGPAQAGVFILESDAVRVRANADAGVTLAGAPLVEQTLRTDADGEPDILHLGRLSFHVIRRSERFGVRIKDSESVARRTFAGIESYPVDPAPAGILIPALMLNWRG
jgi:uncharacterized protein (DUF1684 family)